MKEQIEVYSVKYALTQGVFKVKGEVRESGRFVVWEGRGFSQSLAPKEWDQTLEGAKAKAEALLVKRMVSLKRQLKRLESMEIKVND